MFWYTLVFLIQYKILLEFSLYAFWYRLYFLILGEEEMGEKGEEMTKNRKL